MRRPVLVLTLLLAAGAVIYFWPRSAQVPEPRGVTADSAGDSKSPRPETPARSTSDRETKSDRRPTAKSASAPGGAQTFDAADYPIAAPLNAPGGTIAQDLAIVRELFDAWLSNFPRE